MKINRNSWHYKAALLWANDRHHRVPKNLCPYFWRVVLGMLEALFYIAILTAVALLILLLASAPFTYLWHNHVYSLDWFNQYLLLGPLIDPRLMSFGVMVYVVVLSVLGFHGAKYLWWEVITESKWYTSRIDSILETSQAKAALKREKRWERREAYEQSFCKVVVEFFKAKHDKVCPPLEFVNSKKDK